MYTCGPYQDSAERYWRNGFLTFLIVVIVALVAGGLYGISKKREAELWKDMYCAISTVGRTKHFITNCSCKCKCTTQLPKTIDCVDHSLNNGLVKSDECHNDGCSFCDCDTFPFCELCQYSHFEATMQIVIGDDKDDLFDSPNSHYFDYPKYSNDTGKPINNWLYDHCGDAPYSCPYVWKCSYQPPYNGKGIPPNFQEKAMRPPLMDDFHRIAVGCFLPAAAVFILLVVWLIILCCNTWTFVKRKDYESIQTKTCSGLKNLKLSKI